MQEILPRPCSTEDICKSVPVRGTRVSLAPVTDRRMQWPDLTSISATKRPPVFFVQAAYDADRRIQGRDLGEEILVHHVRQGHTYRFPTVPPRGMARVGFRKG